MRTLLLSSNAADATFFKAAAASASLPITACRSPDEVCSQLQRDSAAITIVDASTEKQYRIFEKTVSDKLGLYSNALNLNSVFYVVPQPIHELSYLINSPMLGHFIPRTFAAADAPLIGKILTAVGSERGTPIESYFRPDADSRTVPIKNSQQKSAVVEELKTIVISFGFKPRMATIIADAADELIMNAIFDAPVDEVGKHIYLNTPRSTAISLSGRSEIAIKAIFDGSLLGIATSDKWGSLNKKKMITQHIGKSYEAQDYETRAVGSGAGAGLGLARAYRNCGGMVFSCETGEKTDAMLFYRKTESFKDFKDQFRFLASFVYFS